MLIDARGQQRMARLLQAIWKETVTQITSPFNQYMQ